MTLPGKTIIREREPTAVSEIQDDGTPVPLRRALNFTGSGVSVSDDGDKTTVTITAGSGSGSGNSYFPGGW